MVGYLASQYATRLALERDERQYDDTIDRETKKHFQKQIHHRKKDRILHYTISKQSIIAHKQTYKQLLKRCSPSPTQTIEKEA